MFDEYGETATCLFMSINQMACYGKDDQQIIMISCPVGGVLVWKW